MGNSLGISPKNLRIDAWRSFFAQCASRCKSGLRIILLIGFAAACVKEGLHRLKPPRCPTKLRYLGAKVQSLDVSTVILSAKYVRFRYHRYSFPTLAATVGSGHFLRSAESGPSLVLAHRSQVFACQAFPELEYAPA
ncbi:hypothetical protein [Amorphus sp. 3PC139-8]|uniref:hypothetical protein n=1 Tax=Amorphus sp. 3PC139-8 TaxID=2735676 RepID=UPI00345D3B33